MITIGIDQSLNNSGITVIGEGKPPSHFSIIPDKKVQSGIDRLCYDVTAICEIVRGVIEKEIENGETNFLICREDYAYGSSNSCNTFTLGELGGAINFNLYQMFFGRKDINIRYDHFNISGTIFHGSFHPSLKRRSLH